jgi:hypothetical protein
MIINGCSDGNALGKKKKHIMLKPEKACLIGQKGS